MTSRALVSKYVEKWIAQLDADTAGLCEAWRHWPLLPPDPVFCGSPLAVWECAVPQKGDRELKIRLSDGLVIAVPLVRFRDLTSATQLNEWVLWHLRAKLQKGNFKTSLVRSQLGALIAAVRDCKWPRPGIPDLAARVSELRETRDNLCSLWTALLRHWDDITRVFRQDLPARNNVAPFKISSGYDFALPRFLHPQLYRRDQLRPLSQTLTRFAAMYEFVTQVTECEHVSFRTNFDLEDWAKIQRVTEGLLRLFWPYSRAGRRVHTFVQANTARAKRRLRPTLPPELVHLIITEFYVHTGINH